MEPPIVLSFTTGPVTTTTPCTMLPIVSGVLVVVMGGAVDVVSDVGAAVVLTAGTGSSTVTPTPITPHATRAPEFPETVDVSMSLHDAHLLHTGHQTVAVVAQSKIIHVLMQHKRSSNDRVRPDNTDHIVIREREVRHAVRISNNVAQIAKVSAVSSAMLSPMPHCAIPCSRQWPAVCHVQRIEVASRTRPS